MGTTPSKENTLSASQRGDDAIVRRLRSLYNNVESEDELAVSDGQWDLLETLNQAGQSHIFSKWLQDCQDTTVDSAEAKKKQIHEAILQLEDLNSSYPGGLVQYMQNARNLLEGSKLGVNPLADWTPSVPSAGETLQVASMSTRIVETEELGLKTVVEAGGIGFVLVAGGLGERLGYNGIKVGISSEFGWFSFAH
jgi:UDP-sugar pyrophosphorylase